MPLAQHQGVVAGLLEHLGDHRSGRIEGVEHRHAVDVAVLAGEDRRAAGRADRVRGVNAIEPHALLREPVDIRRRVDGGEERAVGPDGVGRMIVRHDIQDIGPPRRIGRPGHRGEGGYYERRHANRHKCVNAAFPHEVCPFAECALQ